MALASHILEICELALILAILWLRRSDRSQLRSVAKNQGKLVELVRSSLHPPPSRCAQCEHEHENHFSALGEANACSRAHCVCPGWVDPAALDFIDDTTPTIPLPDPESNR